MWGACSENETTKKSPALNKMVKITAKSESGGQGVTRWSDRVVRYSHTSLTPLIGWFLQFGWLPQFPYILGQLGITTFGSWCNQSRRPPTKPSGATPTNRYSRISGDLRLALAVAASRTHCTSINDTRGTVVKQSRYRSKPVRRGFLTITCDGRLSTVIFQTDRKRCLIL